MEPTGRLVSLRQREKAKCEMWDFERGSGVERTRAPRSAREGAAETRPLKVEEVESEEEGRRGPLGPQRRRSLMGLFLQLSRPDQRLCCCVGEEVEEKEEERTVRERDREVVGKGRM